MEQQVDEELKVGDGLVNDHARLADVHVADEKKNIDEGSGGTFEEVTLNIKKQSATDFLNSPAKPESRKQSKQKANAWKKMPLTREITISQLHEHSLQLVESDDKGSPRDRLRRMSSAEIEEASWQCNGSMLFVGGCKSGQTTFEVHPETKAWRCN